MYYKANGNLKHNGDSVTAGTIVQAEDGAFSDLVALGVMTPVPGANSAEEAAAMLAEAQAAQEQAAPAPAPSQDTWGPTKEPVVAPEAPAAPDAPAAQTTVAPVLAKFTVLKDFEITNADSKNFGKHAVGDVIEADPSAAQSLVDSGTLAPVGTPTGDNL
jgi:hypothetical protein